MIDTLVLFGASGDLAGRLLLPAVAQLHSGGARVQVIGSGHQDWSDAAFAEHVRGRLAEHGASVTGEQRDATAASVRYRRADVTDADDVAAVLELAGDGPVVVYLALPTHLLLAAVQAVRACGLPVGSRVAVEKPFGQDAADAAALTTALAGTDAYLVDHALAMTAVLRLPDERRSLRWDAEHLECVELLWEETLGLEGRAGFYDRAGALRDVVQNHLVQLLCTVAQSDTGPTAIDRRADVLRAVRPLSPQDVVARTRRARWTAGRLADGRKVPGYADEHGVDESRHTETFAELTLELDTPRWAGTRFVLRAGKALSARRRGVLLHPRAGFGEPVWLDLDGADGPGGAEPAAYARIVTDLLTGGTTHAVGTVEAELAWRICTSVLVGWSAGAVALASYPAGSDGP